MWLALKHTNGNIYVCRPGSIPDILNAGEAVYLLLTGDNAYQTADAARTLSGISPDMRHVHAHLMERKSRIGRPSLSVRCVETGEVYPSTSKAAEAFGCSPINLSRHLRYPQTYKTVKGHTFKYFT